MECPGISTQHGAEQGLKYKRPSSPHAEETTQYSSHSLVLHKRHRKANRGRSPVLKAAGPVDFALVRPLKEYPAPKQQELVPLTSVPPRELEPRDSPDGQYQVEKVELPFTPDTIEAARDLIAMMALQPPAVKDKHPSPSRGKPTMMRQSPSPAWHRSPRHSSRSLSPGHRAPAPDSMQGSPTAAGRHSPSPT